MKRVIRNVGFVSTRIAGTDGVSLEIKKWTDVLERNRYSCFFLAGELDREEDRSMLVESAHFKHPEIEEITDACFGVHTRSPEMTQRIHRHAQSLKEAIRTFVKQFDIDCLIPENALTIPMNIPLGVALTEFLAETGMPAVAHHHDFYWERDRFLINGVGDFLQMAFPPGLYSIHHAVLNQVASRTLNYRVGVSNTIIPNVYDYETEPPKHNSETTRRLRAEVGLDDGDILVLQPTRVVQRKAIERSIDLVSQLDGDHPTLVISHAADDEGTEYFERISEYADMVGVRLVAIDRLIGPNDELSGLMAKEQLNTKYTISDIYQAADLVSYPSQYEGFGNAFLETIYYKKPIVVNRYTSFITDIEPRGFDLLLLNGLVTKQTIAAVQSILTNETRREEMVERNYAIAKNYFSYECLERNLTDILERF